MARQIDYRSTSQFAADEVYATMVDPDYLRARLAELGGRDAALLEHHADAEGARYRLRHGLDARDLPPVVRTVLPGGIVVERAERWTRQGPGRYAGEVQVTIQAAPASAKGGMRLRDQDGGGSELQVRAEATVKVPIIGGKIEAVVAEQVENLLGMESEFTIRWLEKSR
jgi:hypothetical protein